MPRQFVLFFIAAIVVFATASIAMLYFLATPKDITSKENNFRVPPQMSERHVELVKIMASRGLTGKELVEYRALIDQREKSWKDQPFINDLVPENTENRNDMIRNILRERGLTGKEIQGYMNPMFGKK